jgi:glycosyltransferase involved in cell wall biosynthesis
MQGRGAAVLKLPTYVLVTPARNEAQFLASTIESVAAQTVLPLRWVIVSDGSTDGTDEIVLRYAAVHPWIELLRMPERTERNFAGKAFAVNAAHASLAVLPYEAIAILDADITFQTDYFSYLLSKLAEDPALGLVGTPNRNALGEIYDFRFVNIEDVSGTCQLFRRACFEAIGGYVPSKAGNIDTIACVSARMKGWKTRTFTGMLSRHHRVMGTAQCGPIRARFNEGVRDYAIGNHPLWQLFRMAYQMSMKPYGMRGLAMEAGYVWAWLTGAERPVSKELVAFHRREEMQRLARVLKRKKPQDSAASPLEAAQKSN